MKISALLSVVILSVCICNACGGGAAGSTNPGGGGPPEAATHFSVSTPSSANSGTPVNFTVTALDAANSVATTYSGTVRFSSSDPQANLPANSALINGTGTFSVTFITGGFQTISATDTATPSITGISTSINVNETSGLTITSGQPPTGTVGAPYGPVSGQIRCQGTRHCPVNFFQLTASGGSGSYSWGEVPAAGSSLPPGLFCCSLAISLSFPGPIGTVFFGPAIYGQPTAAGSYTITLTVSDNANPQLQASQTYTIDIGATSDADAAANRGTPPTHETHHYKLVDLGSTLGGPQSYFVPGSGNAFPGSSVLNSGGKAAGFADTAAPDPFPNICFWDCDVVHAFEAGSGGHLTDLGALPGGGSSVPMWISSGGLVAGISENGQLDPLYAGLPQIRAVLWQQGAIIDLGTLPEGGYQSEANAVNCSGQVVGAALNTIPDPNSMQQLPDSIGPGAFWLWGGFVPYLYQTRAFIWDKHEGMRDLGTLGGTDAQAFLINDAGQVVGYSYTSSTEPGVCFPVPTDSFIWEKDKGMRDLGSLGGTCTLAAAMNNRGQIVGESFTAGDQAAPGFLWEHGSIHELGGSLGGESSGAFAINEEGVAVGFGNLSGNTTFHAALWRNVNSITDLGVIDGDPCSYAAAINAAGQVVGASSPVCDFGDSARAFLWQDGSLFDLNTLIPSGSALYLQLTNAINDAGEIAGTAVDANGNQHAFLLIPCDQNHPGVEGCNYNLADASALREIRPPQAVQARAAATGALKVSPNPMAKFGPLMARHNSRSRRASGVSTGAPPL